MGLGVEQVRVHRVVVLVKEVRDRVGDRARVVGEHVQREGCGRAFHRSCIPFSSQGGPEFVCPVHACSVCAQPDCDLTSAPRLGAPPKRCRMLTCLRCPTAFCDKPSCRPPPGKCTRLGGGLILCDTAKPDHCLQREGAGTAARGRGRDDTSVLDDARGGVAFEHLIIPEKQSIPPSPEPRSKLGADCSVVALISAFALADMKE